MATKDVTDLMVCDAYKRTHGKWGTKGYPYEVLQKQTGECFKVCYRAMERAHDRGFVDFGVSLRTGWLTPEGEALLNANSTDNKGPNE